MKVAIVDVQNQGKGSVDLPAQFTEPFRPVLIRRAVLALQSSARQAYGASPDAGMRHSSKLSKRRRKYRGSYGFGISRVNRKIHSRRGTRFHWVGTFSPQTVGGRRAHAPKSSKQWTQKINVKEKRKAIRSAIAATVDRVLVEARGHKVPAQYPFVLSQTTEQLGKTKEVETMLLSLGFEDELARSAQKSIRAGKGTLRGRKYRRRKGILVVVSGDCPLLRAARNIAGLTVVPVASLNAEQLAPGADAGRATLWTEQAVAVLKDSKLFM